MAITKTRARFWGLGLIVLSGIIGEGVVDREHIVFQEHLSRQKEINQYTIEESQDFAADANYRYVTKNPIGALGLLSIPIGLGLGSALLAYGLKKD